jgi:hypothetical protein
MLRVSASLCLALLGSCRGADDAAARRLCDEARLVEARDPAAGLRLRRRVWQEMPYTGTPGAEACGREIAERMGRVRLLVSRDERGDAEAVDGCAWALEAVELFDGSASPPFRRRWAVRLLERCVRVVGRAWIRSPEDPRLAGLHSRLERRSSASP